GTPVLLPKILVRLAYSQAVALAAPVVFLSIFDYLSLSRSGMEASCFVFLVMATLEAIVQARFVRAGLLCGLSCLVRPEGVLLIAVLLVMLWQQRNDLDRRSLVLPVLLLLVVLGAWSAYAVWAFGSPIPQSVIAKSE